MISHQNIQRRVCEYLFGAALYLGIPSNFAFASVSWEQQAERLQEVSAALLDHMPMAEMPMGGSNVMLKSNVSKLPTTNPTIGSKSEKVPSSPVHGVPTIQVDLCRDLAPIFTGGVRMWGGLLPTAAGKIVGLKASLFERSFGAGFIGRLKLSGIEPGFEVGAQRSISNVNGAITATDADDSFHVDTLIGYGALGARIPAVATWFNVLVAARSARSDFSIPADNTYFQINDSYGPLSVQVAAGIDTILGLNVGIAQLYVPQRVTMTRVLAGIKVGF